MRALPESVGAAAGSGEWPCSATRGMCTGATSPSPVALQLPITNQGPRCLLYSWGKVQTGKE